MVMQICQHNPRHGDQVLVEDYFMQTVHYPQGYKLNK